MHDKLNKYIYFFIGTEAELIKLFPVILLAKEKKIKYKIISSGQNDISKSKIMEKVNGNKIDICLSDHNTIIKSPIGLLMWFIKTYFKAKNILKQECEINDSIMIVHGDTISTVMGARLGKNLGMRIAHIEAGLRSYDLLNPFPEEIDRMITSKCAEIHFASNDEAFENLKKVKGQIINTKFNTLIDSLKYSESIPTENELFVKLKEQDYFVFVMHRQENLANKELVREAVKQIINISKSMKCVIILHEPTKVTLNNLGLLKIIEENNNIITALRMEYFDFMKLLAKSKFVITDGGSNQEELYYMGKPCLLLRKKTERSEGIGKNAIMYDGNINIIGEFVKKYDEYIIKPIDVIESPSELIIQTLQDCISEKGVQ